ERLVLSTSLLPLEWGEQQTVSAKAFVGTKAQNLDGRSWVSSDESIVTVTPGADGEVSLKGVAEGAATVTATIRKASATLDVTVAPRVIVLQTIDVTAAQTMLAKGLQLQLHATGHYNDGTT